MSPVFARIGEKVRNIGTNGLGDHTQADCERAPSRHHNDRSAAWNRRHRWKPGRLAVGYYLKQRGLPFVILDENDRIGDAWRKRWDSLRLFTPGRYNGLPGMAFPGSPWAYPTKDETADYLEAYARAFELPVRTGVKVDRLAKTGDRFEVTCGQHTLFAENVVVATGAFNNPRVPSFARELDKSIVQLHSKEYRNPSQIQKGAVLVVGAGNSGAEIAMELAPHHQTWLSGPDTGQEPARAGSHLDHLVTPLMWFVATRLTVKTALGRKLRDHFLDPPRGIPLGRVRRKDFAPAGIKRVPRMTGVKNGYPLLEDGTVLDGVERHLVHGIQHPITTGSISRCRPTMAFRFMIGASSSPVRVSTSSGFSSSTR